MKRLHLGCGLNTPSGWINVDGSWNARLAKHPSLRRILEALRIAPASKGDTPWSPRVLIHDVRKPLPFPDNAFSAIYSSHLLEHLYLEEAVRLLKGCFRILEPDGVLRLVVPDLRAMVSEYMGQRSLSGLSDPYESLSPADRLNMRLLLRPPSPPSGNALLRLYTAFKDFHSHKWMYDADSLMAHLTQTGFVGVAEMECHQSRIWGIEEIEQEGRILGGAGVCIEGVKPGTGAAGNSE